MIVVGQCVCPGDFFHSVVAHSNMFGNLMEKTSEKEIVDVEREEADGRRCQPHGSYIVFDFAVTALFG